MQIQFHLGVALGEVAKGRGQAVQADVVTGGNTQRAAHLALKVGNGAFGVRHLLQDPLGIGQ